MKKFLIILLLGLLLNPLSGFSQNYKDRGDAAYNSGKYSDAIKQYTAALAYLKSQKVSSSDRTYSEIEKLVARAERCVPLMEQAETLFANANSSDDYSNAKKAYQNILQINVNDGYSKGKISECDQKIRQIEMHQADEATWASIINGNSNKAVYQQYLDSFPDGAHVKEAKNAILEFEDKELWALTKKENTKEAYEKYLANKSTSLYESEAKMAIYTIEDEALWVSILKEDTEEAYNKYVEDDSNPAKNHMKEALTKLSVIKTAKMAEAISTAAESREKASEIVEVLETASKTIVLSEKDTEMLKHYKSISDHVAFCNNPTIEDGLMYLETYPDSEYANWVSDKLSELYANNLSVNSTENDYQLARSYARSETAKKYVETRITTIKRKAKASKRSGAWDDRAQLGIGVDAEMLNSLALGPKMEFKLGAADNIFNFSVGAKALWWKPEWLTGTEIQHITFMQVPIYAAAKLNLFRTGDDSHFYIGGEWAYNLNFGSKISDSYDDYMKDKELVNSSNMSASARIGFCWEHSDLSFYYRHDLSPVYNQEYIYQQYNDCYTDFEKVLNERFRIGISYTCYIIF